MARMKTRQWQEGKKPLQRERWLAVRTETKDPVPSADSPIMNLKYGLKKTNEQKNILYEFILFLIIWKKKKS